MLLVLIASAAGEVPRDPTTVGNATTIKLIAAHPPLLTHPGRPSTGDWAAEEFPATGPYRVTIAEGVLCQLNSCCSYTSKTLPLPPSSTASQGVGGIQAATTLNCVGRKTGNPYLARPATNGQPRGMTAHREPRPTKRPHGETPSREISMRAIDNSTQSSLNPYTTAQPNGCCSLGLPCYRRSEGICIIRSKAHQAPTPAEASVWPECSEHAAHCLTLQAYPDPSTLATSRRAQGECTSIMACASTLVARAWSVTCDGWDAIDGISPSSDYVLSNIVPPVAAWLLHMLSLASAIWHLHQHNLSRVRLTHKHTSTRILDAIGDTLDKLKRSEASVAAAKLMVALAVLNTSDTAQAWALRLRLRSRLRKPK